MSDVPKHLTVVIDTREQKPLTFPSLLRYWPSRSLDSCVPVGVGSVKSHLRVGDYCIAGWERLVVFERKASAQELAQNLLTSDYRRAMAALDRLCSITYRYLIIDASCAQMYTPHPSFAVDPTRALDALLYELSIRGIVPLWLGRCQTPKSRQRAGDLLLRIALRHILDERLPAPHPSRPVVKKVKKVKKVKRIV